MSLTRNKRQNKLGNQIRKAALIKARKARSYYYGSVPQDGAYTKDAKKIFRLGGR